MAFCLVDLNKSFTFASDDESQKRLVARHRVFFDANYSRTRRLERSLIRNPQNSKSPELPLYKEILRILTKLRKKGLWISWNLRILIINNQKICIIRIIQKKKTLSLQQETDKLNHSLTYKT